MRAGMRWIGSMAAIALIAGCPPQLPPDPIGDPDAGQDYYAVSGCANCHGGNAQGGLGPELVGVDIDTILETLDGTPPHPEISEEDALDLEAWLASL